MSLFFLLILFLTFFSCPTIMAGNGPENPNPNRNRLSETIDIRPLEPQQQRVTYLHFYFHDIVSGRNATAVRITSPPDPSSFFGVITMMDDLLTEGPEPYSKPVGRAQGMYASAAQQELGFLQAMNLLFTEGEYDGSVLTVLGRNPVMNLVREMPVIGGSGVFRFARGFALAKTHWINMTTGDAIVEYNVTIMHLHWSLVF